MPPHGDDFLHKQKPLTPAECGALGPAARIRNGEDPVEMTRAARESDNHPAKLARWLKAVLDADPSLSAEDAIRQAELARSEHFAQVGRQRWKTRTDAGMA